MRTIRNNAEQILKENYNQVEQHNTFAEWVKMESKNDPDFYGFIFNDGDIDDSSNLTDEEMGLVNDFIESLGNSKDLSDLTQDEFVELWNNADRDELVTPQIRKKYTEEEGGYWYVALENLDAKDIIYAWFEGDVVDDNNYVPELDARI